MDNIINAQTSAKTFLRTMAMISPIVLVLSITLADAYAVPPTAPENCQVDDSADKDLWQCCWTETDPADPEKIEIYKCQHCWIENGAVECSTPGPDPSPFPTRGEDISPGDTGVVEQPPETNQPSIKSGDSVFPNDGGNVLDDSQPTNPTFNSNKGTIIDKNLAQDQPMQFSSNNEQSQESKELTETNNADKASNAQENDDLSTSETTASFAQKGNAQNSPVPPECPKQGPIPPDCTMKPKF